MGSSTAWGRISSGAHHTCAIQAGELWCWGYNFYGSLGLGDEVDRDAPAHVGSAATWATVDAGGDHTCAVRTNGDLWCWGSNAYGQLGMGDEVDRSAPAQVALG
jgi:alpha-tubulin suppressor-like RCC1 family protein